MGWLNVKKMNKQEFIAIAEEQGFKPDTVSDLIELFGGWERFNDKRIQHEAIAMSYTKEDPLFNFYKKHDEEIKSNYDANEEDGFQRAYHSYWVYVDCILLIRDEVNFTGGLKAFIYIARRRHFGTHTPYSLLYEWGKYPYLASDEFKACAKNLTNLGLREKVSKSLSGYADMSAFYSHYKAEIEEYLNFILCESDCERERFNRYSADLMELFGRLHGFDKTN